MIFEPLPPLNRYASDEEREQWFDAIRRRLNLFLPDSTTGGVEGAIRYNATTNKHQGYDGTTWNDLY